MRLALGPARVALGWGEAESSRILTRHSVVVVECDHRATLAGVVGLRRRPRRAFGLGGRRVGLALGKVAELEELRARPGGDVGWVDAALLARAKRRAGRGGVGLSKVCGARLNARAGEHRRRRRRCGRRRRRRWQRRGLRRRRRWPARERTVVEACAWVWYMGCRDVFEFVLLTSIYSRPLLHLLSVFCIFRPRRAQAH